jgi:hypothetical protein
MRKEKKVIITNPKLINLRNFLRRILINKIHSEIRKLSKKFTRKYIDETEPVEYEGEGIDIQNKKRELDKLRKRSICQCTCGSAKDDMVYYPPYNAWYCVDCYEKNRMIPLD